MDDEIKQLKDVLMKQETEHTKLTAENEKLKVDLDKVQSQTDGERIGQEQEERERIAKY